MLQALAPRHVRKVDQAVDAFLDFDERAELGQVAHLAGNRGADRILLGQLVPRVALDLLQPERDAACAGIDAEHHRFDAVADVQDLRRVLHALAPRHLADVDQTFDPRLELDERAVVRQADDLAAHSGADWIALDHVRPRIVHQLLVAERDAFGCRIVLEHDHVDLVVDLEQLRRMRHAAPRHVGDVEEAVDPAEIDERAVIRDVLDDAAEDLAFGERVERVLLLLGVLLLEEDLAREHDVAALLVDLDDAHPQLLAAQGVEIAHGPHVDLRSGQERADTDVHGESPLDALDYAADDDFLLGVGLLNLVPDLHLLGFFAREDDVTVAVFGALEQHVNGVAGLHGNLARLIHELVNGDDAFGLVANVDDDFGWRNFQDGALHDLAFRDVAEAVIVKVKEARIFLWINLIVHLGETRCLQISGSSATSFGIVER